MFLPGEELVLRLKKSANSWRTKEEIEIKLNSDSSINLSTSWFTDIQKGIELNITAEFKDANSFIKKAGIFNLNDIAILSKSWLVIQFLTGNATIYAQVDELEAELGFQRHVNKIMVHSIELHFYDEIHENISLPEQFIGYIEMNEGMLQEAVKRRYKMVND